jgi:hypothetical protein
MDLSRFDTASGSEDGRWIEPVGLDGKKIGLRIKVLGPDSRKYATLKDEVNKSMYKAIADATTGINSKEAATDTEREARLYAKLTEAWESDEPVTWDGKPFPCTEENAFTMYMKAAAIREQVKRFIESRRNFTKPEQKS